MRASLKTWVITSVATTCVIALVGCNDLIGLTPGTLRGGSGGAGGGAPTMCVPSETADPVVNGCGVFVSSSKGSDLNAGTKEAPYATIQKALAAADGKPVFLCNETFVEPVDIKGDVTLYGALDCAADWSYAGATKPALIAPPSDAVSLRIGAAVNVALYDVTLQAADATVAGGSSIGLIAGDGANVELVRCAIEAGNGHDGASGEQVIAPAKGGQSGAEGGGACSAGQVVSPDYPVNECGDFDSFGGLGGIGSSGSATAGIAGGPTRLPFSMNAGEPESGVSGCTPGTDGLSGPLADSGEGGIALGTLEAKAGYIGSMGASGKDAPPGQGGGGGGASKGGTGTGKCTDPAIAGGASGGNGGAGGCGGLGGKGGQAGGASIAIVSLGANLSFFAVSIVTKAGGSGGDGADGQVGGNPGSGGNGGSKGAAFNLKDGCAGGNGGYGGTGGTGGGGRGGHSIAVAHTGAAVSTAGATVTLGMAGAGGLGAGPTGNGAIGVSQKVQAFD